MKKYNDIKKLALETILFSMEEIKENLRLSAMPEDIKTNSEAMLALSEAFINVKRGR